MSNGFWLTDERFKRLEPFLPADTRGVARVDDRRVISGVVQVLKSGCRWKDAAPDYGLYKTLYNRFVRWRKGVWETAFVTLATAGGPPAEVLLNSADVKAHRSAAGGKGGPSDTIRTFMAEIDPSGGDALPEGAASSHPELILSAPQDDDLSAMLQRVPTLI
jgi:transposase